MYKCIIFKENSINFLPRTHMDFWCSETPVFEIKSNPNTWPIILEQRMRSLRIPCPFHQIHPIYPFPFYLGEQRGGGCFEQCLWRGHFGMLSVARHSTFASSPSWWNSKQFRSNTVLKTKGLEWRSNNGPGDKQIRCEAIESYRIAGVDSMAGSARIGLVCGLWVDGGDGSEWRVTTALSNFSSNFSTLQNSG